MPFRASFDCLWCGRPWDTREPSDLEGWASLCPDCVGKAQENAFLRFRLREALRERASGPLTPAQATPGAVVVVPAPADVDDWYLRRGRYSEGPLADVAWQAELDQVTRWLDDQPLGPEIVELAAETGWWSPLLAQKGRLWLYDESEEALELARERLVAHGLRAHSHARSPWAEPERQVDTVFTARLLGRLEADQLVPFLKVAHSWLKEEGTFVFIDARDSQHAPAGMERALREAGFAEVTVEETDRFFVIGVGRR
jgi:hypothetical protein